MPVHNTQICVFNNRILYAANNCSGSIFQLVTDMDGRTSKYNITPGWYYFRLKYDDGITKLIGSDSLEIKPQIIVDTMMLVR
jgi:hypothetical protein